jgi:hypothetical protein
MPIFISYSHADKAFATTLAAQLVKHRTHVWIDEWELKVGDSLIDRIQEAVQSATALLVIVSRASVASEWCKKEMSAGLLRELEEKRVVVLPVLVEDCEIPLFLRGKLYADFRTDPDSGLNAVLTAVAPFASQHMGRVDQPKWNTDWAQDWGIDGDDLFFMRFIAVQHAKDEPFAALTQIHIYGDKTAASRYMAFADEGLDWVQRASIVEAMTENAQKADLRVVLTEAHEVTRKFALGDAKAGLKYYVRIACRRLGIDNGRDVLVDLNELMVQIHEGMRNITRPLTKEETERLETLRARSTQEPGRPRWRSSSRKASLKAKRPRGS